MINKNDRRFISNRTVYIQKNISDDKIEHYGIYGFLTIVCGFISSLMCVLQFKGFVDYSISLPIITVSSMMGLFCIWDYSDYRKLYFKKRFGG